MKKIFSITLVVLVCLVLVGCGGKTGGVGGSGSSGGGIFGGGKKITCVKNETEDGYPVTETITVSYEGNKLTYLEGSNKTVYDSADTASITYAFMPMAEAVLEAVGFEVESTLDEAAITMSYKGNMEEISKNVNYADLDYDYGYDTTEASFLEEMTEDGYTCK